MSTGGGRKKSNSEKFKKLRNNPNLKYEDIQDLVEYLVETNSYKYTFDGFAVEDIAQEIRKKCFLLLDKWNNKKGEGNPIWFFGLSIQNHLKNLRRDHNIKNPNYNPNDKFHTKSMNSLDISDINIGFEDYDIDFSMMSNEVRDKLSPKYTKYYDEMMETFSTKGMPQSIKKKIFKKMKDVMGELGPEDKMNFKARASYIICSDIDIKQLNIPSGEC